MKLSSGVQNIMMLPDLKAFWSHADATQPRGSTPYGERDAEERRDLRAGQALKQLLERLIGPEEGPDPVQCQNWDWNDDATRPVFVLTRAFRWDVVRPIQLLLVGELADFRVLLMLQDSWDSEIWGGVVMTANELAVQEAVARRFMVAA